MDEHLRRVQEHRRHHGLRHAIENVRVDVAWASLVMIDQRAIADDRRGAVATALDKNFEGLVQAVRESWHQQADHAADTHPARTRSAPGALLSRSVWP